MKKLNFIRGFHRKIVSDDGKNASDKSLKN